MKKYFLVPAVFIWLWGVWLIQLPSSQSSPVQETIQLTADMDTYVRSWSDNTNYGAEDYISLSSYEVGGILGAEFILLHFDLSSIPSGAVIDSATLKLYLAEVSWADTIGVTAYYVNDRWSEYEVTWANKPNHESIGIYQIIDSTLDEYKLWNITSYARNWHSDPDSNNGVFIQGPTNGSFYLRYFESRERIDHPPVLEITYTPPSPPPGTTATRTNTPSPSPTSTPTPTNTPTSTPIPCPVGDKGDTFDLASPLWPNTAPVLEYICPSGDKDFWKFDLQAGETVDLTLYNLPADFDLALISPTGNLVASSESWGANRDEVIRETVYTQGTYRAIVWGKGVADWSNKEAYTLAVETSFTCYDPDAAGDTFQDATAILPSLPDAGIERLHQDAICPEGDVDFYSFIVPGGHLVMMNITLSDLPADYDLKLYNPNGTLVVESDNTGTEDESIVYGTSSQPGTWRVAVDGNKFGVYHSNDYTLEVKMVGLADLTVEGIEITQAIQDLDNNIPLIAGKNTVARVYLGAENVVGNNNVTEVSVELRAYNTNHTLIPPVLTLDGGIASQLPLVNDKRLDYAESLNFTVPTAWLAGSSLHLHAEVNPGPSAPESDYNNNTREATIAISRTDPINLVFVPLTAAGVTPNLVNNADLNAMVAWLRNVYPNSRVRFGRYPVSMAANYNYKAGGDGCGDGWSDLLDDLADLFASDLIGTPQLPVTYYYGLLDPSVPTKFGGCGRTPGHVAAGFLKAADGHILAHELTHNFGAYHAPSDWDSFTPPAPIPPCDDPGRADTNYPQYVNPAGVDYRRSSIGEVGLNLVAATPEPQDPSTTYDFMSYCSPNWVSPYRYLGLLGQMPGSRPNTSTVTSAPAESIDMVAEADVQSPHLFINGRVREAQVLLLRPIWVLPSNGSSDVPPNNGPYSLELQNAAGNVLVIRYFDPQDTYHSDSSKSGSFYEIVPFDPDTKQIVFRRGIEVVHTIKISPHAPVVRLLYPNGSEVWDQGKKTITWQATDADGDTLAAHVRYSADGGVSWQTLGVNVSGSKFEVDVSGLPGGNESLMQVLVSDGVNTTIDVSDAPFTVAHRKPVVFLFTPPDGLRLHPEDALFMQGAAFDPEDGALEDERLSWSSNLDGFLGTGESLAIQSLSIGHHLLTLSATDSDGMKGIATTEVYVGQTLVLPFVCRSNP